MEAASLTQYQDKCQKHHHNLITPKVYWNYVTPSVLVTEQISGTPLTQKDKILESGFNLEKIAEDLMLIFLHDATHTGYFHGDLHQGNIFITDMGGIALLDFGVMGYLDATTRSYLAKILYGFVIRDYDWIAQLHFDAGYIPKHHSVIRFSQALRAVGEPIFGKTANDISMGKLLAALLNVTQRFDMETRPELILLQKNMVSIEGVCKMLYPQTDIWKISRPLLEKWVKENMGLQNKIHKMIERLIQKILLN
jgi:ubiquinone biosynthesis protein